LTPPERIERRVYEILPQEAMDWVRENGIPQPPTGQTVVSIEDFDPDAAIIEPTINGYISGNFEIKGNARGGPYKVEIGRGVEPSEWVQIGPEHGEEVVNDVLERLDTTTFEEGLYTLRLTVNREDGPRVWTTPVTIDNTPPTAIISDPQPNRLYVLETDEQININVLANDTWAIDRVIFTVDSVDIGSATVAPFNERWRITMRDIQQIEAAGTENWLGFESSDPDVQPGRVLKFGDGFMAIRTAGGVYFEGHTIKARVIDRAGNVAESEEVVVYVRRRPSTD